MPDQHELLQTVAGMIVQNIISHTFLNTDGENMSIFLSFTTNILAIGVKTLQLRIITKYKSSNLS